MIKNILIILLTLGIKIINSQGLGEPREVDINSPIVKEMIEKANNIGSNSCIATRATINSSTRYNLWTVILKCDDKICEINVSEETPLKYLEYEENCVLCCF